MTKRETTSLLIKLMGIYCLVQFAPSLIYVLGFLATIRDAPQFWIKLITVGMMILLPVIWIVFCIFLIRNSDNFAERLYIEDSEASQLSGLGFQDMQILGYNFIGILILVQAFPQIVSLLTTLKVHQVFASRYSLGDSFYFDTLPRLLSFLTQLALGLVLFLKPRGMANLWKKFQTMRYERVEPDGNTSS